MENLTQKAPYLISYPMSKYMEEELPFRKLYLIIDTFTQVIRYNGCIFLCEYLNEQESDPKVNIAIQQLLRPSLGSWLNFIKVYGKYKRTDSFIKEVIDIFTNLDSKQFVVFKEGDFKKKELVKMRAVDALINLRNKLAHGAIQPSEQEATEIIETYTPCFEHVLSAYLPLYENYSIAKCEGITKGFLSDQVTFKGLNQTDYEIVLDINEANYDMENELFLIRHDGHSMKLSTIFHDLFLPEEHEKYYTYDGLTNKAVIYTGVSSQKRMEELVDSMKAKFLTKNISLKWDRNSFQYQNFVEQVNEVSSLSISLHRHSGKYIQEVYKTRKYDRLLEDFFESTKSGCVITAEAGLGKTNLLCNTALKLQNEGHGVYFVNGLSLTSIENQRPLFSEFASQILETNSINSFYDLFKIMDKYKTNDKLFVLIVDGSNESYNPIEVLKEADLLIQLGNEFPWLKVIISFRKVNFNILKSRFEDQLGKRLPLYTNREQYFMTKTNKGLSPEMEIEPLSVSDLLLIYEQYRKTYGEKDFPTFHQLPDSLYALFQNPLNLQLYFKVHGQSEKQKPILNEMDLFSVYHSYLSEHAHVSNTTLSLLHLILKEIITTKQNEVDLDQVLHFNEVINKKHRSNQLMYNLYFLSTYERLKDIGVLQERFVNNHYKVTFVYQKYLEYLLYDYVKADQRSISQTINNYSEFENETKLAEIQQSYKLVLVDLLADEVEKLEEAINCCLDNGHGPLLHLITDLVKEFIFKNSDNQEKIQQVVNLLHRYNLHTVALTLLKDFFYANQTAIAELVADTLLLMPTFKDEQQKLLILAGRVYQYQSKMTKAISLFQQAEKYTENPTEKTVIGLEIARTLRQDGRLDEAINQIESTIASCQDKHSIEYAESLIQKGLCQFAQGDAESALATYYQAQEIAEALEDHDIQLYNLLGISTALEKINKVDEGLSILKKVYEESKKYGYQQYYVDSMNGMAKKYILLGDYDNAIYWAKEGLFLWEISNFYRGQLTMCTHIIQAMYLKGEKKEKAIPYIQKGKDLLEYVKEKLLVEKYEEALRTLGRFLCFFRLAKRKKHENRPPVFPLFLVNISAISIDSKYNRVNFIQEIV